MPCIPKLPHGDTVLQPLPLQLMLPLPLPLLLMLLLMLMLMLLLHLPCTKPWTLNSD